MILTVMKISSMALLFSKPSLNIKYVKIYTSRGTKTINIK